jgi:cob(I)alamin adenosyltransferase
MKIYTQTGDRGKTSLLSGERVPKTHVRINAYGDVDELNAVIGALIAAMVPESDAIAPLKQIQSDLFQVGAWLAATPGSEPRGRLMPVTQVHSARIEASIDKMQAELPDLTAFILPGGCLPAAWAHVARTVCRRAERSVIDLAEDAGEQAGETQALGPAIAFMNRLSDYFFVLARWLNHQAGVADVIWRG